MYDHVAECISAGVTTAGGIDNDLESLYEEDILPTPLPIISGSTAPTVLQDLTHYFQSLPITTFLQYLDQQPSTSLI